MRVANQFSVSLIVFKYIIYQSYINQPRFVLTCFILTVLKKRNLNIRKCAAGVAALADTCQNVKLLGVNTSICFCNTDGCNEAGIKHPVRGLLVLAIFVVYIMTQIIMCIV